MLQFLVAFCDLNLRFTFERVVLIVDLLASLLLGIMRTIIHLCMSYVHVDHRT
jgi:hypothetical protein